MFTKESCGPCGLVKKYIKNSLDDSREDIIEEVFLEDFSDVPIPEENSDFATRGMRSDCHSCSCVVLDEDGELLETYIGGTNITSKTSVNCGTSITNESQSSMLVTETKSVRDTICSRDLSSR